MYIIVLTALQICLYSSIVPQAQSTVRGLHTGASTTPNAVAHDRTDPNGTTGEHMIRIADFYITLLVHEYIAT